MEGTMRRLGLALAIAASLTACSGGDDGPAAGPPMPGCHLGAQLGMCISIATFTSSDCVGFGGTWLPDGCPPDGRVGICTESSGGGTVEIHLYSPAFTVGLAEMSCDGSFVATAPPAGGPPATAWCDLRSVVGVALCSDVAGPSGDLASLAAFCANAGGAWSTTGSCPTSGRTGTCSYGGTILSFKDRYYDAATAADDAASCVAAGDTWTPN